ncbi:ABC transporter permease [Pararhizobium arenae]|uniref:ABC transporter permease n=1 Tax=Pararhizobium arenae TaxID=1856850 RepID=UPI00094AD7D1|nr:ABC transporter permease [Pararhizobium arenae]
MTGVTTLSQAEKAAPSESSFLRQAMSRFLANTPAVIGALLLLAFVAAGLLAPWIAPYGPNEGGLGDALLPPSVDHLLGTDKQGRDQLSLILYGGRTSLLLAISSVTVALLAGGVLGAVASAFRGTVDAVIMRLVDVWLAIPGMLLALAIVALLGTGLVQITIAVAVTNVPVFARLFRTSLAEVSRSEYIEATRSVGASEMRIFMRHTLPNAVSPLIVAALLAMASAVVQVAGLGFLGLGPADRLVPEWGTMLTNASSYMRVAPLLTVVPCAAIVITAISFNLVGDGLQEAFDPQSAR